MNTAPKMIAAVNNVDDIVILFCYRVIAVI
jgi:hypothetical protein